MSGEALNPSEGVAPAKGHGNPGGPSKLLQDTVKDIRETRGRHKKDCTCEICVTKRASGNNSQSGASTTSGPKQNPPASWSPVVAGTIMDALHLVPASLTGFDGFRLTPEEKTDLAQPTADILNDLLPYDAGWVKIAVFLAAVSSIEAKKLKAFNEWKEAESKKQPINTQLVRPIPAPAPQTRILPPNPTPPPPAPVPAPATVEIPKGVDNSGLDIGPAPGVVPPAK